MTRTPRTAKPLKTKTPKIAADETKITQTTTMSDKELERRREFWRRRLDKEW
jgi:hypothetical protein